MSEEPRPEADPQEQAQSLLDEEDDPASGIDDPEVPEADRLDQRRAVAPSEHAARRPDDPEVPDADAAEQSQAVVDDEEGRPD